jgi:hypothetical protein
LPIGFSPGPQQISPDGQCLSDEQNSPVQVEAHVPFIEPQQYPPYPQWESYLQDFPIQDLAHLPIRLLPRSQQFSPDGQWLSEEQDEQFKAHVSLQQYSPDAHWLDKVQSSPMQFGRQTLFISQQCAG